MVVVVGGGPLDRHWACSHGVLDAGHLPLLLPLLVAYSVLVLKLHCLASPHLVLMDSSSLLWWYQKHLPVSHVAVPVVDGLPASQPSSTVAAPVLL